MDREYACSKIDEALSSFKITGECIEHKPYGNGHINDTFLAVFKEADGTETRYIIQRMNHEIFKNPVELVENIHGVTSHLRKKITAAGGDHMRETLNMLESKDGNFYYKDSIGCYWRLYYFISGATCFDLVEKPEHFYQSGIAFGNFQKLLSDYPASTLHETIVNFHNTKARFARFLEVVKEDKLNRAKDVKTEIDFILARKADSEVCTDLLAKNELPIRVTHNDTKLNNVMIDDTTGVGICVLDLDTVMPGLAMNDFGDSIRFGASTAKEDETDLDKVSMDINLFDIYAKGFLSACGDALTEKEIDMLPFGAKIMTFECGMRFLTDYLEGDVYFKIHREGHNLDRCRTQLKLVWDMEQKWDEMKAVIDKYKVQLQCMEHATSMSFPKDLSSRL